MSPLSTPLSPLAFLARSSTAFRTKLAVVDGDRRWSFEDLATSVQQFAEHLTACGLQPGDRVAMIAPNSAELLIAHFAVPTAGGVLVTLNTRMAPPRSWPSWSTARRRTASSTRHTPAAYPHSYRSRCKSSCSLTLRDRSRPPPLRASVTGASSRPRPLTTSLDGRITPSRT